MIFNSQGDAKLRQYINGQTITPGKEAITLPKGAQLLGDVTIEAVDTEAIYQEGYNAGYDVGYEAGYAAGQQKPYSKELQYIQSSGVQYIDTGFTPNQDTRLDITLMAISAAETGAGTGCSPYGSAQAYNSKAFECYTSRGQYQLNYDGQYNFMGTAKVGQLLKISHNKNNVSIEIGADKTSLSYTYQAFTAPYTLTLFGIHRSSVLCGLARIYSCKIYNNGNIVRDFIPVLDNRGVACLFDKANKQFYYNAGSGSFSYEE